MHRQAAIEAALAKRNFSCELAPRIERLLDGVEDRTRLRCCDSGCYICVRQLMAVLAEVENGEAVAGLRGGGLPCPIDKDSIERPAELPAASVSPPNALPLEAQE